MLCETVLLVMPTLETKMKKGILIYNLRLILLFFLWDILSLMQRGCCKVQPPNLTWQYFRNCANRLSMRASGLPVVSRNKAAKHSPTGLSPPVEMRVPPGILVDGKRIRANGWLNPSIMVTSLRATCSLSVLFLS